MKRDFGVWYIDIAEYGVCCLVGSRLQAERFRKAKGEWEGFGAKKSYLRDATAEDLVLYYKDLSENKECFVNK